MRLPCDMALDLVMESSFEPSSFTLPLTLTIKSVEATVDEVSQAKAALPAGGACAEVPSQKVCVCCWHRALTAAGITALCCLCPSISLVQEELPRELCGERGSFCLGPPDNIHGTQYQRDVDPVQPRAVCDVCEDGRC